MIKYNQIFKQQVVDFYLEPLELTIHEYNYYNNERTQVK